ncbi:MAG: DUF169 domain-containing protein [Rhizobacter sp.]|nr:DUF169 domain-containing protein [Chlorobiales bacterium]
MNTGTQLTLQRSLAKTIRDFTGIARDFVALKFCETLADIPEGTAKYQGKGIYCGMWSEVRNYAEPFYTVPDDHICGGGTSYTGMGQKDLPPKMVEVGWNMLVGEGKIYYSRESVIACQESVPASFKKEKRFEATVMGRLEQVPNPDVVLFFCNAQRHEWLAHAYGFESGELMQGLAGLSLCAFVVPHPHLTGKPIFSPGDLSGRELARMNPDELCVSFPFAALETVARNLSRIKKFEELPQSLLR